MSFSTKVRKFIRTFPAGSGQNSVDVTVKKHDGDTSIGSASTSGSADLAGLADITVTDYEPHYAEAIVGATTLYSSSKDVGFIGTVSGYDLDLYGLAWTDGVVEGRDNELAVTAAGTDMNVDIDTGAVLVLGHPARNTASAEVTIGANASGNARIDRIVVRFVPKGQTTEGDFSFAVVEGTPAASPSAPSLTQSSSVWEISLAQVAVANGAATISQGNITDERPFCYPKYPSDPGADRVLMWDDSASTWAWATLDTGLSITGTTLSLDADLVTLAGLTATTDNFIVSVASAWASRTPTQARATLGLATTDSPEFTAINLGHASNTTITRTGAGDIAIEGNAIYRAGGTDVPLADGGTGASLVDPNADRIFFWDDSESSTAFLSLGTGLSITTTTLGLDADLVTIAGLADPNADRILFWDDSESSYAYLTVGTNLAISTTTVALATNVDVAGTLDVTGATVLDSTLTVAGDSVFNEEVTINKTLSTAFLIHLDDGSTRVVSVNTSSPALNLYGGTDLNIFSDSGSTVEFQIDGATGATEINSTLLVHAVSANALVVEHTDGTNTFQVDTSNHLVRIAGDIVHTGSEVGFFSASPVIQQTVTGSRGGNAALASLINQLVDYGLIVDGTSA